MIEYTTAILLILITFIVAMVNIKFSLFTYIIILIDIFTLIPDIILSNGSVVIGYNLVGSNLIPLIISYPWLRLIAMLGMLLCVVTAIVKEMGGF